MSDFIPDRKYNALLQGLMRGEGLLQARIPLETEEAEEGLNQWGTVERLRSDIVTAIVKTLEHAEEDIGVTAQQRVAVKTREKWEGATRLVLRDELKALQEERRYNQGRAKRLKETGVGENVEEARARHRLEAKIAKWKAETVGDLLSEIRMDGPQSTHHQGVGGNPGMPKEEVEKALRLFLKELSNRPDEGNLQNIFDDVELNGVRYKVTEKADEFFPDAPLPETEVIGDWRDARPKLEEHFGF